MAPPAYHLRTNKAVDRHLFLDVIRRSIKINCANEYNYYSFGGPYLDDFRLVHENFPEIKMTSIERDEETFKRQKFHIPSGEIDMQLCDMHDFLSRYDSEDKKSIFWLDYTGLDYNQFEEFMLLLSKVAPGSVIKITLHCGPTQFHNMPKDEKDAAGNFVVDKTDSFRKKFSAVLPSTSVTIPRSGIDFSKLLQDMLQIAAQKVLSSAAGGLMFQPLTSSYYKDGVGIFTLTGMVCKREDQVEIRKRFSNWPNKNLFWRKKPFHIDVPTLSTQERLHLQGHLPCTARTLQRIQGYKIDGKNSIKQLKQYAEYYIQYPYFLRGTP